MLSKYHKNIYVHKNKLLCIIITRWRTSRSLSCAARATGNPFSIRYAIRSFEMSSNSMRASSRSSRMSHSSRLSSSLYFRQHFEIHRITHNRSFFWSLGEFESKSWVIKRIYFIYIAYPLIGLVPVLRMLFTFSFADSFILLSSFSTIPEISS